VSLSNLDFSIPQMKQTFFVSTIIAISISLSCAKVSIIIPKIIFSKIVITKRKKDKSYNDLKKKPYAFSAAAV